MHCKSRAVSAVYFQGCTMSSLFCMILFLQCCTSSALDVFSILHDLQWLIWLQLLSIADNPDLTQPSCCQVLLFAQGAVCLFTMCDSCLYLVTPSIDRHRALSLWESALILLLPSTTNHH